MDESTIREKIMQAMDAHAPYRIRLILAQCAPDEHSEADDAVCDIIFALYWRERALFDLVAGFESSLNTHRRHIGTRWNGEAE